MNKCKICNGPTRPIGVYCEGCHRAICDSRLNHDWEWPLDDAMVWAAKRGREAGRAEMREAAASAADVWADGRRAMVQRARERTASEIVDFNHAAMMDMVGLSLSIRELPTTDET